VYHQNSHYYQTLICNLCLSSTCFQTYLSQMLSDVKLCSDQLRLLFTRQANWEPVGYYLKHWAGYISHKKLVQIVFWLKLGKICRKWVRPWRWRLNLLRRRIVYNYKWKFLWQRKSKHLQVPITPRKTCR
jgi:hypothetical protein